jgi:hypothetical protein
MLRFTPSIMGKSKNLEFLCVEEENMGWPEEFTMKVISHVLDAPFQDYDNDEDSNDFIVNKEVEKGIATLVEEITFKRILEMEDTMGF